MIIEDPAVKNTHRRLIYPQMKRLTACPPQNPLVEYPTVFVLAFLNNDYIGDQQE